MTREEFKILIKGLKAVYSDPKFIADQDAFDVWYAMLQDLDYKQASASAQAFMMTSKYPPTIADIRQRAVELSTPAELSTQEAWALVSKAIKDSGYHSREQFEAFPDLVKKVVVNPDRLRDWAMMDMSKIETVVGSFFQKAYEVELKRRERIKQMSPELQIAVKEIRRIGYDNQI